MAAAGSEAEPIPPLRFFPAAPPEDCRAAACPAGGSFDVDPSRMWRILRRPAYRGIGAGQRVRTTLETLQRRRRRQFAMRGVSTIIRNTNEHVTSHTARNLQTGLGTTTECYILLITARQTEVSIQHRVALIIHCVFFFTITIIIYFVYNIWKAQHFFFLFVTCSAK